MKRVAVDCRLMYYRRAGIAQYTRRLVQALASVWSSAAGDEHLLSATVLRTDDRAPLLTVLLDRRDADIAWLPRGVRIIRTITPAHHRLEFITLPCELAMHRIDLLHSPDLVTARGRFLKVVTIHDLYFLVHPEVVNAQSAWYYGHVFQSVRHAHRVIAVSDFTRGEILRLIPSVDAAKVTMVHEAADDGTRPPGQSTASANIPNAHYALFVGTFEPRKNLATLLLALRDQAPDCQLVVVGETGWVDCEPARLARELGLAGRVHFAGRASDEALDLYYRRARMLVFPSLSEGFGLPVLEAMSRGVPVICSNAGALPEVAGDAALLHDPLDGAALARSMQRLWADDRLHEEYRQRGLRRAALFSWARAASETWRVYSDAFAQVARRAV